MAKNALAKTGKKREFLPAPRILKDDVKRRRLINFVDETVICKTKILDQQEAIRTLRETASEELNIDPKVFNNLVSLAFNNNHDQRKLELENELETIEALLNSAITGPIDDDA